MGFKVRGYNKIEEKAKTRDYSLFAIACEGTEREPEYFGPFDGIDRIKVDIIKNDEIDRDSAPKKILGKVERYVEEVGLSTQDNDSMWCVIDVDKWPMEQITELADYCNSKPNFHIMISNPCFEIWLLYHKYESLDNVDCAESHKAKQALHNAQKGGYYYLDYLPLMKTAIKNAQEHDSNPDPKHYFPNVKETKVYQLAQSLYDKIGEVRFNKFVDSLIERRRNKK